jgi:hypothetical protein
MRHSTFALCALTLFLVGGNSNVAEAATSTTTITQAETEAKVREYFKDAPAMIEIARCESKFRQFTDAGNVLRSAGMIGVFQFYESIHASGAKALGFDLATLEGNLGYAKHVYKTQGTTPWNGSRYCWEIPTTLTTKSATLTGTVTSPTRAELLKKIATLTKLIAQLQKQLDAKRKM